MNKQKYNGLDDLLARKQAGDLLNHCPLCTGHVAAQLYADVLSRYAETCSRISSFIKAAITRDFDLIFAVLIIWWIRRPANLHPIYVCAKPRRVCQRSKTIANQYKSKDNLYIL